MNGAKRSGIGMRDWNAISADDMKRLAKRVSEMEVGENNYTKPKPDNEQPDVKTSSDSGFSLFFSIR